MKYLSHRVTATVPRLMPPLSMETQLVTMVQMRNP